MSFDSQCIYLHIPCRLPGALALVVQHHLGEKIFVALPRRSASELPPAQKVNPKEQTNVSRNSKIADVRKYGFYSMWPERCRDEVFKSIRN